MRLMKPEKEKGGSGRGTATLKSLPEGKRQTLIPQHYYKIFF